MPPPSNVRVKSTISSLNVPSVNGVSPIGVSSVPESLPSLSANLPPESKVWSLNLMLHFQLPEGSAAKAAEERSTKATKAAKEVRSDFIVGGRPRNRSKTPELKPILPGRQ